MSHDPADTDALEQLPDENLIALFLDRGRRDERPFSELFRRHRNYVWGVCLGFFGNSQDAEDITQDVFLAAYRKLEQFRGQASVRTWLHRIAANRCKNELRRRSRRIKTADSILESAAANVPSEGPDPETTALRASSLERLEAALASLREEDRAILRLVDVEQTPYKEACTELGLSMGAVKMRVMRARMALRDAMRAKSEEDT